MTDSMRAGVNREVKIDENEPVRMVWRSAGGGALAGT
jgi:hypothetical protein